MYHTIIRFLCNRLKGLGWFLCLAQLVCIYIYVSFRRVCSEDRLASDLCIQTHVARHSLYLSEERTKSLCVRKTYIWRNQGWSWKSPHYNSSCCWWCYILSDKWFMMNGIKKNHSSMKLSSLKKLIEALCSEDFHLSRQIEVPNWEIIWLRDLKLELLLN